MKWNACLPTQQIAFTTPYSGTTYSERWHGPAIGNTTHVSICSAKRTDAAGILTAHCSMLVEMTVANIFQYTQRNILSKKAYLHSTWSTEV